MLSDVLHCICSAQIIFCPSRSQELFRFILLVPTILEVKTVAARGVERLELLQKLGSCTLKKFQHNLVELLWFCESKDILVSSSRCIRRLFDHAQTANEITDQKIGPDVSLGNGVRLGDGVGIGLRVGVGGDVGVGAGVLIGGSGGTAPGR